MRFTASTTASRRIHPAEPQRREAVDFGKCARHHDVLAGRDELDPRLVIVAPHIFGIGGIEHEQRADGKPARSRRTSANGK